MTLMLDAPASDDPLLLGGPESALTDAPAADRRRWARRAGVAVGLLVIVAALLIAALSLRAVHQRDQLSTARDEAAAAARTEATAMTSYDYRTVSADFAAVAAQATGTFKSDFAQTSSVLAPMVTKSQAVATGAVRDVAVEQVSRSAATVLVFVDQTVTSTASKGQQSLTSRLRMTLVRDHGRWLVSGVDLV